MPLQLPQRGVTLRHRSEAIPAQNRQIVTRFPLKRRSVIYLTFMRALMAVRIMSRLTVKISAVFRWSFAVRRKPAMISLAEIIVMIDVSVKMFRPMEPGASADE